MGLVLGLLIARWFGGRRGHIVSPLSGGSVTSEHTTRIARISRLIVFVCAAYYVIVGISLHVLEPEYDPRYRFMSDYAWGAYGWLMTTTFFVLGLAAFTVAAGLRDVHQSPWSARIGFGVLAVGAPFVCLAGVFRGFPLHDVASAVALPSFVMAALLLSWSFRQAPGWQTIYRTTLFDRPWNALPRFVSFLAQCRDARVAAASFPFPFLIVAFGCRPPVGSGNSSRYLIDCFQKRSLSQSVDMT